MTVNRTIISELEHTYGRLFPDDLKQYLLVKYAEEPFPYVFSEQDLYINIMQDIRSYEAGQLNIAVKDLSERWKDECEYLRGLYIQKSHEVSELQGYITELEQLLLDHGLETPRMAKRRSEMFDVSAF
jgi:hypothetical protein